MKSKLLPLLLLTIGFSLPSSILASGLSKAAMGPTQPSQKDDKKQRERRKEESRDYYKKWLDQDVVYIITPEERKVFQNLKTDEEREQFIEQFWARRDPDPRTAANEFKEEHYRRIAYANEHFTSGKPGWMTDRGRIYITHGPPDEKETHPSGGSYQRKPWEGGGFTSTYPFEVWWYRYMPGVGSDVELEFVDPTGSGEYRLALNPDEKDALLHVPGAGLTIAEELGLATKADRPYFSPGNRDNYPMMATRAKDNPFERYETYANVQRPEPIKYKDLQEIVKVNVSYNQVPFKVRKDYFRLNDEQVLVPLTLEIANKDLTFKMENGNQVARVAVYGLVTSITNRVVKEFDDDLMVSFKPNELEKGLQGRSLYQKILPVDKKMRYKVDLVIKDLNSDNVGVQRQAIIPPHFKNDKLVASSLLLSDFIHKLGEIPKDNQMFVLGDVWIRPSLEKMFKKDKPLGVYLQVYNAGLDQATLSPALTVTYQIYKDSKLQFSDEDESGESIQFFSGQRVVLLKDLPIKDLEPGRYQIAVQVKDRIKNESVDVQDYFQVEPSKQMAANEK